MPTPTPTVPALMALAHGLTVGGPSRCFYCGAPCGETHPTAEFVKSSFTGRDGVRAPGSDWVCGGCVLCLRERADITLIDGTRRAGQMMRGYSWVVTPGAARAADKSHLAGLRLACLEPPGPPYAICLSDSGKKHLLYRGVVNHDRRPITVTLEGEPVTYGPIDLADRLALVGNLVAATGKPALKGPVDARMAIAVMGRFRGGEGLIARWAAVREQPLSRLAAWLSPNHEICERTFPADVESEAESEAETRT